MLLFFVEDEHGNDKFIFARGFDHAAEQFVTWQMVNEAPMGNFGIDRITIASRVGVAVAHLRQAIALGAHGLGAYDETSGWVITPIEDERDAPDLT